jgi:hypothetical protein
MDYVVEYAIFNQQRMEDNTEDMNDTENNKTKFQQLKEIILSSYEDGRGTEYGQGDHSPMAALAMVRYKVKWKASKTPQWLKDTSRLTSGPLQVRDDTAEDLILSATGDLMEQLHKARREAWTPEQWFREVLRIADRAANEYQKQHDAKKVSVTVPADGRKRYKQERVASLSHVPLTVPTRDEDGDTVDVVNPEVYSNRLETNEAPREMRVPSAAYSSIILLERLETDEDIDVAIVGLLSAGLKPPAIADEMEMTLAEVERRFKNIARRAKRGTPFTDTVNKVREEHRKIREAREAKEVGAV